MQINLKLLSFLLISLIPGYFQAMDLSDFSEIDKQISQMDKRSEASPTNDGFNVSIGTLRASLKAAEKSAENNKMQTDDDTKKGIKRPAEEKDINKRPVKKQTPPEENKLTFMFNGEVQSSNGEIQNYRLEDQVLSEIKKARSSVHIQMMRIGNEFAYKVADLRRWQKQNKAIHTYITLPKCKADLSVVLADKRYLDELNKIAYDLMVKYSSVTDSSMITEIEKQYINELLSKLESLLVKYYQEKKELNPKALIQASMNAMQNYLTDTLEQIKMLEYLHEAGVEVNYISPNRSRTELKLHDKIVVIDDCKVITGSANMTYSGLNNNLESNIFIQDREIANLFMKYLDFCRIEFLDTCYSKVKEKYGNKKLKIFYEYAFNILTRTNRVSLSNEEKERRKIALETLMQNEKDNKNGNKSVQISFAYFQRDDFLNDLVAEIEKAKFKIKMQFFLFGDKKILQALVRALQKNNNLEIEISLDKKIAAELGFEAILKRAIENLQQDNSLKSQLEGNLACHFKVHYLDINKGIIHDKVVVIDDHLTILGSANITDHVSEGKNLENIIKIEDKDFAKQVNYYIDYSKRKFADEKQERRNSEKFNDYYNKYKAKREFRN